MANQEEGKVYAEWHDPILWASCPYCGEGNDYWKQICDMDCPPPLEPMRSYREGSEFLDNLPITCLDCGKEFRFDSVIW